MNKILLRIIFMVVCLIVICIVSGCEYEPEEFVWHEIGDIGEPAFENGWLNATGAYETGAFGIDGLGFVHLKGLLNDSSYSSYAIIFYLPEGYRPERTLLFDVYAPSGSDDSGSLLVYNDGSIALDDPGTAPYSSAAVSLDGVIFFTEQ